MDQVRTSPRNMIVAFAAAAALAAAGWLAVAGPSGLSSDDAAKPTSTPSKWR